MANFTIEPNMNLILPTPGVEFGPQYAFDQNQDLLIIGAHTHGPGSGVPITPLALNINTNVNFQTFSPYNVSSVIFSTPASNSGFTTLYTNAQSGGGVTDLFYNDGAGNVIALTKAGLVNATIASLPGESYAGGTFTWVQGNGSTTPANFDIGSITIRPNTAGTANGVVLSPPSGISSQYNVALPIVPSVVSIMQLDSSGNMLATLVPDNSTIVISSQTLQVPTSGIGTAQIANGAVTPVKLSAANYDFSSSTGNLGLNSGTNVAITQLSATITTSGRPVRVNLQADGTSNQSYLFFNGGQTVVLQLWIDGSQAYSQTVFDSTGASYISNNFSWFIPPLSAGSHTFAMYYTSPGSWQILYTKLVAVEV